MARTISDIKKEMTDRFIAEPQIITRYNLQPGKTFEEQFSTLSIESILFYTVAFCHYVLEQLFTTFTADVNAIIATTKPHTLQWYAQMAKAFQYGFNLLPDSDLFDNSGATPAQISASKIVKHASVVTLTAGLRVKIAKQVGANLAALTTAELQAFTQYMQQVKDAGVKLLISSSPADDLKLALNIYYNPLVLNANGDRIDGSFQNVVPTAIRSYLQNLPFNGVFMLQSLVDALQRVPGVNIIEVLQAQAKYGLYPFTSIQVRYTPDAGYLVITDANLTLTFIPDEQ